MLVFALKIIKMKPRANLSIKKEDKDLIEEIAKKDCRKQIDLIIYSVKKYAKERGYIE